MNSNTKFHLDQLRQLVGGKIVRLVIDDSDIEEFFGIVVSMPNGKVKNVFFLQDEEGNGPGSFDICDDVVEDEDEDSN